MRISFRAILMSGLSIAACGSGETASATPTPGALLYGQVLGINPMNTNSVCNLYQLYTEHSADWTQWWNSHLDGVVFFIHWDDVYTPSNGVTYSFISSSPLVCGKAQTPFHYGMDGLLGGANGSPGLIPPGVHLGVVVVAGSHTPTALMSTPGILATGSLVDSMYFTAFPTGHSLCLQLPLPWEANYISDYKALMRAIKNNLGGIAEGSSTRLSDVALAELSGNNETSGELIMAQGGSSKAGPFPCDGSQTLTTLSGTLVTPGLTSGDDTWIAEGYSSTLVETQFFEPVGAFTHDLFGGVNYTYALEYINGTPQGGGRFGKRRIWFE